MTPDQEQALAITLDLLLDQLRARGSYDPNEEQTPRPLAAIEAIGALLGETSGLGGMARVFDLVIEMKLTDEEWREGVIDRAWSGFGDWAS